jgi:ParB family transcriptional regulator, chromosome partitioning protein
MVYFIPIIVTEKLELLSGFRRLSSAKALGWDFIEAKIVQLNDSIEYIERELDENLVRKNFTPDEITRGYELLRKKQNPNFFIKLLNKLKSLFIKKNP